MAVVITLDHSSYRMLTEFIWLRICPVTVSYEHGNESSDSINAEYFINLLAS
jgi:hypothetical protein